MSTSSSLSRLRLPLNVAGRSLPALGFGTLIPDAVATHDATKTALEVGFRALDTAERYRTEAEVGSAMAEVFQAGGVRREDVYIITKLWNNNHRPERVKRAFEASRSRLRLDYVDLYLIHTPFAFRPGDDQEPRDIHGKVIYDYGITLLDTWRALEELVDGGRCRAIGLSDVSLDALKDVCAGARIQPAVVHVEAHPYLPQRTLLEYCHAHDIVLQAFAAVGHGSAKLLQDPIIARVAANTHRTPAQVLLAWGLQRGTAVLTTSRHRARIEENFAVSEIPMEAIAEIDRQVKTSLRFNTVVETGVPGFIPSDKVGPRASAP